MMKTRPFSFKTRLAASFALVIAVSFAFLAYLLDKRLENSALDEIKQSLTVQAQLVSAGLPLEKIKAKDLGYLESLAVFLGRQAGSRVTLIDPAGNVLAESQKSLAETSRMENHADRPEVRAALAGNIGQAIRYSSTLKTDMLYIAVSLRDKNNIIGVTRLALPLGRIKHETGMVRRTILVSLIFAAALAFGLGWILSVSITRPISLIAYTADKFSGGDFSRKILLNSSDEIGTLARCLNSMAANIEAKVSELKVRNQHLAAILEGMVEGILLVDKAGRIVSLNPAGERIFAVSRAAIQGKLFLEVIPNNDIAELINTVLKAGQPVSQEITLVWPLQKDFRINASPVFEKDQPSACLLVIHDVTEFKKLETIRKDFVANVSHELKTPLTAIRGFVETLLDGALQDKDNARQFLKIIQDHTARLENLVNDILSLAHLESRDITLDKERFLLRGLADEILAGFAAALAKKEIKAENNISPDLAIRSV